MPMDRGAMFEDPLADALQENGLGELTGAGTMQSKEGEIEFCGLDLDLFDIDKAIPFICDFLNQRGAPKGSKLQYQVNGNDTEAPFGTFEGLAIYLNGTDLPANVYQECDVNEMIAELHRLLGKNGHMLGHWQGPKETALYFYGPSFTDMRSRIADYLGTYPLLQKSRVVQIA